MIPKNYTKQELIDYVRTLSCKGTHYTKIARILNENGIPTVSQIMQDSVERKYIQLKEWKRWTLTDIVATRDYSPTQLKYSTKEMLEKLHHVHNHEYEYPEFEYTGSHVNIKAVCPIHGEFHPVLSTHLRGSKCIHCIRVQSPDDIVTRSKKKHNNFYTDYDMTGYTNSDESIIRIKCPVHGWFEMKAGYHVRGGRCVQCIKEEQRLTHEEILKRATDKHHGFYEEYDLSTCKNLRSKMRIKCPKHGWFTQNVHLHLRGSGCPKCRMSKGEREIMKHIDATEWKYQHSFPDCTYNSNKLWFDFYSPVHNTAIEYQGAQHYRPAEVFGGQEAFNNLIKRDAYKVEYCKRKGIKLIRISYKKFNQIEKILRDNRIYKDALQENLGIGFL